MEGARLIHAEDYKLTPPCQVVEASEAYRAANDWFAHFLDECCDLDPGSEEKSGALYSAYRSWAISRNEYVRSTTDFYAAVEKNGYASRRTNRGKLISGLRLLDEFELN